MNDGDVFHRDDIDVKPPRAKAHRRNSTKYAFKLFHSREHLKCGRRRFRWERHMQRNCCIEELWLLK